MKSHKLYLRSNAVLNNSRPQEATAEEVEFDDEEVGPEEIDENKEY